MRVVRCPGRQKTRHTGHCRASRPREICPASSTWRPRPPRSRQLHLATYRPTLRAAGLDAGDQTNFRRGRRTNGLRRDKKERSFPPGRKDLNIQHAFNSNTTPASTHDPNGRETFTTRRRRKRLKNRHTPGKNGCGRFDQTPATCPGSWTHEGWTDANRPRTACGFRSAATEAAVNSNLTIQVSVACKSGGSPPTTKTCRPPACSWHLAC